ncbi:MAG TPA: hypothetical protein VG537_05570 [Candidatus Kapabacteria bacterium]|jgi:hypothetical protein|nr:hypothetical protein [Candidatus Kapabacteria bacterium]
MSRFFVPLFFSAALIVAVSGAAFSQMSPTSDSSVHQQTIYRTPVDSMRYDSTYRARKAMLDKWVGQQRRTAAPQEDFLSVYAGYGGYLQILPKDLNQFFSERALRTDPTGDRDNYSTVDRAIILAGHAQLTKSWGIYFEYDYTAKFFYSIVDSVTPGPQNLAGLQEELDLNEHALIVGGTVVLFTSPFYRLRATGGFGGMIAFTTETETGASQRTASAEGYQVNFDLLNDFRFADRASFTIDLLTRSIATGKLKTSSGEVLDTQFGRGKPTAIAPNASNFVYGVAAGLVYYF